MFFDKVKEPIFLKETSNAEEQLENLKALKPTLNVEGQKILKRDIKFLEYGIAGEKNIEFELKNSHMPMYILHDICLENDDLSAQIDYLVFTKKLCFVIESKNLYGNIEINNAGDFIRRTEFRGKKKREGIYSPVTQNQRHVDLMKKVRVKSKSNILSQFISGRVFDDFYKPVVVLSNPKTVLNAKFAKEEMKDKVIRADQLVKYIKDANRKSKEPAISEKTMFDRAQFYMNRHKNILKDYTKKYESYKRHTDKQQINKPVDVVSEKKAGIHKSSPVKDTNLFKELKAYRLEKSREEKKRAYRIYSDKELKNLISKMPRNKEELQLISGFGEIKVRKYGDDILKIIQKY